jgi:hypothetical protein
LISDLNVWMGRCYTNGLVRTGLRKRAGPDVGRSLMIRIQLLHNKPRDALPRVRRWPKRPKQLYSCLHQLNLRDVLRFVEP